MQIKRTKIVATIGPASETEEVLVGLVEAGANVFRFNLKHNTWEWHQETIKRLRTAARKVGKRIAVMIDIPRSDYDIGTIEDFDILALSYLKEAGEIDDLKNKFLKKKLRPMIVAKIENRRALANLEKIIKTADGIMVARGDLGEAITFKELAFFQKQIIEMSRRYFKPVIVATEMLLSMVTSTTPARAEATDVANAVYDGTDAVMLSQETAIGKHPAICVKTMRDIVEFAENTGITKVFEPNIESIMDELFLAGADIVGKGKKEIKAIVVLTKSGRSGFKISAFRNRVPIFAIAEDERILNGLMLGYGIVPVEFKDYKIQNLIKKGENVLVISGQNWLETGSTNTISIVTV